jgi:type I restriction enzyme, S subunit
MEKLQPKLRFPEFREAWRYNKIKEVTSYVDYRGRAPVKTENGHFLVTAKNIKKGFIDYDCSKEYVSEDDYLNVMSKGLPALGDILFTTEAPMGNVAQVDDESIALAQRVIKFRGNNTLSNRYLLHFMLSDVFQNKISEKAIGSTVQGISGKELHNIIISFPSIEEQTKIATFLSAVDEKLNLLKEKKALLEDYKKGMMQKIFSQELRFKDENGKDFVDWEEKTLGEIIQIQSSKRVLQEDWTNEGVPFYRTREIINLSNGEAFKSPIFISEQLFDEIKMKYGIPKVGDILVTGVGTIGQTYIVKQDDKFYFKDGNVLWFKLNDKICSEFLNQTFKTTFIKKQLSDNASITTVATFTIDGAKKTIINLPSIQEQNKIANFLSAIDEKIELVTQQIEDTQEYKKGLLQQMFC